MGDDRIAVLFVHGVGIREPDYARTAIAQLRKQFRVATGHPDADRDLVIESAYWAPAVVEREDRLGRRAVPGFASGWFSTMNRLTQKVATGSTAALVPLAVSGLVRHVPGIPRMHWPTLRWAVTNFVGDVVAYQVSPHTREVYDAVHERVREALDRLADRAPDAPLFVVAHSLGSVIAADHFYDLSKGRRTAGTALSGGQTLTGFYTLGSPIALWTQRDGDFARPLRIPARTSPDPVLAAAAEWINFYDADDVLSFPLKGLSQEWDEAVDEDRSVSVGAPIIGMSPVSHVAYWNDAAVIRPIANSIAWLWNARRSGT
ncbi:hypothetical protein [Nakamurella sp.]|uniref:hypothetical protein n=1 Tax=Nakamurella sp. TaxID=1869182 RepID=UPI003B3A6365